MQVKKYAIATASQGIHRPRGSVQSNHGTAQPIIDATPLIGLRVGLDRTVDVPCAMCGQTIVAIGKGAGPHVASLHCVNCNRHRGWLPTAIAEFLLELITRFGRPSEAITIRNSEIRASESAAPSSATATVTSVTPNPK